MLPINYKDEGILIFDANGDGSRMFISPAGDTRMPRIQRITRTGYISMKARNL